MSPKKFINPLTRREMEIMNLIVREQGNKAIADQLFLSVATVETHRRNILQKLGLNSAIGLFKWALKHGFVST
jgi:DNA-binding NarL/FixJ family response regulator